MNPLARDLTRFFASSPAEFARTQAIEAISQGTETDDQKALIRARLTAYAENGRGIAKQKARELLARL